MNIGLFILVGVIALLVSSLYAFFIFGLKKVLVGKSDCTEIIVKDGVNIHAIGNSWVVVEFDRDGIPFVTEAIKEPMTLQEVKQGRYVIDIKDANNVFSFIPQYVLSPAPSYDVEMPFGMSIYPSMEVSIPREGKTQMVTPDHIHQCVSTYAWSGWVVVQFPKAGNGIVTVAYYGEKNQCLQIVSELEHAYVFHVKDAHRLFELVAKSKFDYEQANLANHTNKKDQA